MSRGKRKPERDARSVGLVTPAELKKVADGREVRSLRESDAQPEGPILPETREAATDGTGSGGIFGTASSDDAGRGPKPLAAAVLDTPGRAGDSLELNFTSLLRKIALEEAPEAFQDADVRMSNLEILARKVFNAALHDGINANKARELVIDRLEGKAGRAAPVQGVNTELEDQLDRAAVDLLNEMAPKPKDTNV